MATHSGQLLQIYGDGDRRQDVEAGADKDKWLNRFRKGMETLKGVPSDRWKDHQEDICEAYREVYRDTWRYAPTAKCLANCPNLMIYDDHEVRDNWGDVKEDWDATSADFFVARCAWIVSMEYQRQLYEDVDFFAVENIHQVNQRGAFHKAEFSCIKQILLLAEKAPSSSATCKCVSFISFFVLRPGLTSEGG
jgi:hypothetical protein